jgi:prolyl-tRNA editing enzyme YbaK/EbsC (Cys-tRNA(Pro) deacylase)
MNPQTVKQYIKNRGLDVEFFEHQDIDALTTNGAVLATGAKPENVLKVLLFIDKFGNKAITIIQGSKKVDTKKIPGLKKPDLATPDQVKKFLKGQIGGLAPIALPNKIKKVIDKGILGLNFVYGSGGSRYTSIKLSPQIITDQPNCEIAEIAKE